MKPLELVVYERDEYGDYVDTIAPDGKQYLIALEDVEVYCMDKRLTDAELAAEYYAQDAQCRCEQWIETVRGDDDYEDWERAMQSRMYERLNMLHRFATLPHYDEPTETGNKP